MPLRLLPLVIGPAILLPLAAYVFRRRHIRGAAWYCTLLIAIAVWSALYAVELVVSDPDLKLLALKTKYIGIVALPVAWLGFILDFVGREPAFVRRVERRMVAVAIVTLLIAWTNDWHQLFWGPLQLEPVGEVSTLTGRGPGFWLNVLYTYAALLVGLAILVGQAIQSPYLYRKRAVILVAATVLPWIGNLVFVARHEAPGTVDLTPFLFTCTALIAAVAVFRYGVLEPIPTLRDARIGVIGDGLLILDASHRIADLNRAAETILGLSRARAAGEPIETVLPEWPATIDVDVRQDVTLPGLEGERTYDVRVTPIHAHGRLTGYVVLFRDVTERRRLEEELRQAQRMEAVGKLAGGVAHDFNNLLTAIIGFAALAEAEPERTGLVRDCLSEIRRSGEQAAALTRQLLAFGRRQMLRPVDLDLSQVVDDMHRMLGRLIGEHIELVVRRTRNLHAVRADRAQLEQVIVNLVVNARDAMPRGGRLTIRTENVIIEPRTSHGAPVLAAGHYASLIVEDSGDGIDPAILNRIFEPFFTTKNIGRGTGLGLATVYGIVKQSNGDVQVRSVPGQGTTFTVVLPAVSQPAMANVPARRDDELATTSMKGASLLVVEDDPGVRRFTAHVLRDAGWTVLEAQEPADALAIASSDACHIDALLTDVVLPGINGSELAERVRMLRPGLRVLFMSGYAPEEIVARGALPTGAQLLGKPFTPEELRAHVAQILKSTIAL
jgi:signal transduction histidine kinase/CheY-like chemotaxis protein